MVIVTLSLKQGAFQGLEAKGHADSGEAGHDLVCAALSAIVLGGLNALGDGDDHYAVKKGPSGYLKVVSLTPLSQHDALVLETIVSQIQSLASSHPKNVRLERKESQ